VQVVDRDRAGAYADAVKRALPHATQVADRYHLVQNLRDHLQQFRDRKRTWLPEVEDSPLREGAATQQGVRDARAEQISPVESHIQTQVGVEAPTIPREQEPGLSSLTYAERKKKISRDKRYGRYEQVLTLHQAGMGQRAIAREMHMSRRIVCRYLVAEAFPERTPGSGMRARGKSKLAPHLAYLRDRWNAGEQTSSHLFREIKERGYTGSESLLRRLLGEWRAELPPKPRKGLVRKQRLAPQPKKRRLSSRSASFLMILPPSKQTQAQQQQIEQMSRNEDLGAVYQLSQEFVTMLKERQVEALDAWLNRAKASHVSELSSFVNGIRRDDAAVRAVFSSEWSNGATEGHINRLKFLKRQMFGRAHLDLLRVKVLHAV